MSKIDMLRKQFEQDLLSPLGRAETLILVVEEQMEYLIDRLVCNTICPPYYEPGKDCDGVGNCDDQVTECKNCWREHLEMNS